MVCTPNSLLFKQKDINENTRLMSNLTNLMTGTKILEEVESPINGKLTVVRDLAWGTYIKGGGLTQSGGVMYSVWKKTLKLITNYQLSINNCLILGLGGGDAARLVKKYWPAAKIVGVDLDPIIVELGKKYLRLDEEQVQVQVQDAYKYCKQEVKSNKRYDLVCVDVYVGDTVPAKFNNEEFLKLILKLLVPSGIAVFNQLYFDEKRRESLKFQKKLEKIFAKVTPIYPQANVMFVCTN